MVDATPRLPEGGDPLSAAPHTDAGDTLERVKAELASLPERATPRQVDALERRLYRDMPMDSEAFVRLCDGVMRLGCGRGFWMVTVWVKKRGDVYRRVFFPVYERWLLDHTDRWGTCDVLCYRVLNPMMERFPELRGRLVAWADDPRTYVRRAAAVAVIRSHGSFTVSVPFAEVEAICDRLKADREPHVEKAIGWLLKYAYLSYPTETVAFLEANVASLSRTTFRYALEKMPPSLRDRLMARPRASHQQ